MSLDENKALVRRFYDEVVNQHKLEALDEIIGTAADGAQEGFGDRIRRIQVHVRSAFPDLHESVDQLIAEGDWVVVRTTLEGTHTGGDYVGIAATDRHMQIPIVSVWRINSGRLVDGWYTFDRFSVYEQLGVVSRADLQR